MNVTTPWTDEEHAELVRMWREGLSATQIAKALGTGRSRNAVIGRAHRSNLPMRMESNSRKTNAFGRLRSARNMKRKVIYTPVAAARIKAPTINPRKPKAREAVDLIAPLDVPFLELQRWQCKAVTDDARYAQKFCGHMRAEDSVYCAAHAALYAAPPQVKGKAA